MNPKKLQKIKKQYRKVATATHQTSYIQKLKHYGELFNDISSIKFLINNALLNDRLLRSGLLPQPLPKMLLPDDVQDTIFKQVNAQYPQEDPRGDRLWNTYIDALPKLDRLLRNYRDYLEDTYGMWSYTNSSFTNALSKYLAGAPILEVMAGNGYLSKGLRNSNPHQIIYTTDSQDWIQENETGRHPVTTIEKLDALSAVKKYGHKVQFILMSWAPDKGNQDWQLLQLIRKDYPDLQLLVIGEKDGATNSPAFWKNAQLSQPTDLQTVNQYLKTFDLIDEQIYLAK
ncbi:SAM-dependent methyltransferase [uncultured Limosilactobacillus sp.]|uniref:SAM-dependent methyltransferase n=1 Tax=uncultured Limosilactobacillus sp. TaxID=2837629 RepID=UPI0025FCA156|nr:SAM-dependent methyltransferase [uncultured Limosilactobacillus sp.]